MKLTLGLIASWATVVFAGDMRAQGPLARPNPPTKQPWAFTFFADGYIVPDEDGYVTPIVTADHRWLHLEARYNYEDLRTGSLWVGYTFNAGKKLFFSVTPMVGGVFGRTTGIAPGLEASLTYKRIQLSISNEYVFDTKNQSASFYYDWPQLTYSPVDWFHTGLVAQRTKVYHTGLDTQGGFFFGVSHKNMEFTTYIFNVGLADPSAILEAGFSF